MNTLAKHHTSASLTVLLFLVIIGLVANTAFAQTTAFTYQGRLYDNGIPANGTYDLQFTLRDAASGGNAVGVPNTNVATAVSGGIFTVTLDFGGGFDGSARWLEIGVRTNGSASSFTALAPRQSISSTPYAIQAANATTSATANSVAASGIVGQVTLSQLPNAVVTNAASGVVLNGSFAGNASALTNLPASNLVGTLSDTQLSSNVARLNLVNTAVQASATPVVTSGFITDATIINGGAGYVVAPAVTVSDATGSNAVITATISGGVVTALTVQNPGAHYSSGATLTIAAPPSNAIQTFGSGNVFNGVNTFSNASNFFAGNGSGLTGLRASNLTGTASLPAAVLPSNVAFLNSNQTFTGVNVFNNNVGLGIASPFRNFQVRTGTDRIFSVYGGGQGSGVGIESVNDANGANQLLEFRGTPYVFSIGNVAIGTANTTEKLEVAGVDTTIRIRNTPDSAGTFIGETWTSLQLGMYNPSGGAVGVIPAGAKRSFFGFDATGKVGSLQNNFPAVISVRNALDDGSGNMSIAGNFNLSGTTATAGIINAGGSSLIHSYGSLNFFAGSQAGNLSNTGFRDTGVGVFAMQHVTSGGYNSAVGYAALYSNTSGGANAADGCEALFSNLTGNNNTASGFGALYSNTTANDNSAYGFEALFSNTIGSNNTAVGVLALNGNTSGSGNSALGWHALQSNSTGSDNTAFGVNALLANTGGYQNTASGENTLTSNTTGTQNTASGYQALFYNSTGSINTAHGVYALFNNTTGNYNTAVGGGALQSNTTGTDNTATGFQSLLSSTTGNNNTADGYQALFRNTTGIDNTASGFQSLLNNTVGNFNSAYGTWSLRNNTNGVNNCAFGEYALLGNFSGSQNSAYGAGALQANTTGGFNTAIGYQALSLNTSASYNVAVGEQALQNNVTGGDNTGVGRWALVDNLTGANNSAVGSGALQQNTNGMQNSAIGFHALNSNKSGGNNTAAGAFALNNTTTGSNNIAVGYQAGFNLSVGSNNIDIGNTGVGGESGIIRIGTPGIHSSTFIAGAINGNGGGLTNLNPANLSGGTASINISGNAATASSVSGAIVDSQLSTNVFLLNGTNVLTGSNLVAGVLNATNSNNVISGSLSGNGSGLTNLSADAVMGGLTTNLLVLVPGGGTNVLCFTNGILRAIQ